MRYVVIMAGGSGTRLWPLSKQGMPKQLLTLFDGKSLLRLAYERVAGFIPDAQILTCTSASYADEVAAQLPELPRENILGEPEGRDSLNAVAWSTAVVADRDAEAVVAMVTADQIITPIEDFQAGLNVAFEVAVTQSNALVTLGIVPESPHTGYGYLQRGTALPAFPEVYQVTQFKEKPDRETAERYLDSGNYWWNSGMFVWRASTFLTQLAQQLPRTASTIATIVSDSSRLGELFGTLEKTSVDYAIMEPAAGPDSGVTVFAVGLAVDWRDLGGYASLAAELATDAAGNAVDGLTFAYDSSGCLIVNTTADHLVATLGLRDCLVVHTERATLVAPMAETERVKQLVGSVRDNFGVEFS